MKRRATVLVIPIVMMMSACAINNADPIPATGPSVSQALLHDTCHSGIVHHDLIPFAEPLQAVHRSPPSYPVEALKGCFGGIVVVELLLSKKGRVSELDVLVADETGVFVDPVIKSVWRWRFRPHLEDGVAVPSRAVLPVEFKKPHGCG